MRRLPSGAPRDLVRGATQVVILVLVLGIVGAGLGCNRAWRSTARYLGDQEVVSAQRHRSSTKSLPRNTLIAVAPFWAEGEMSHSPARGDALALVERLVAEALAERGAEMIPAPDMTAVLGFATGLRPLIGSAAAAEVAGVRFGAQYVILGRVRRYREREGGAAGASAPASVAFELTLYDVPGGRKVWCADFDHTQHSLLENPLQARRYPGRGTRWLGAAELARWGVQAAAHALTDGG